MTLRLTLATHPDCRDLLHLQLGALGRRCLRHELEAEGQSRRHDVAQMTNLHPHLRNPTGVRLATGDLDDQLGYREFVQWRPLLISRQGLLDVRDVVFEPLTPNPSLIVAYNHQRNNPAPMNSSKKV